jgi:XTP/dITP diphosphohydrolase
LRSKIKQIVAATNNEGKLVEIKDILTGFNQEIKSLKDFKHIKKIKESGLSFYENSLIKAKTVYEITRLPTLADDSGLCVEFLDGMPGIFSSRFAGRDANDKKNNKKLLELLRGLPIQKRKAYFKCVIVFIHNGKIISASGRVNGYIAEKEKGANGFGYDPVFYLPRYKMTMAQLPIEKKNKISHRYKALMDLKRILKKMNSGISPDNKKLLIF